VLFLLYAFLIIFVIVDVTCQTKNYYNFVSLSGIIVYLFLMLFFSTAPRKVSMLSPVSNFLFLSSYDTLCYYYQCS